MTTIAIGASSTIAIGDGGTVSIVTNGGFWLTSETPVVGSARTTVHGPLPHSRVFGPYVGGGASLIITNLSVNQLLYVDYEVGSDSTVAASAGATQTITLSDRGTASASSVSGFWTSTVTPTIGAPISRVHGPGSVNIGFGPYPVGAVVAIVNQTSPNVVLAVNTVGAGIKAGFISNRAAQFSNTGVAPFLVQYDASPTTDTQATSGNTFREGSFAWIHGETTGPGVAAWGTSCADSTRSRNVGYGSVGGHVYETPGSFQLGLLYKSAVTKIPSTASQTIIVLDPDDYYAGKTVYFSNTADFTGAPSGATKVTTNLMSVILGYVATGWRLLGKGGDTFIADTNANAFSSGSTSNGTLGRFGPGTSKPRIYFSVSLTSFTAAITLSNNWRVMDWEVRCRGNCINGTIVGTTLTANSILGLAGTALAVGDGVYGTGVTAGTVITFDLGGGQYTVNNSQNVGPITMSTGNQNSRGIMMTVPSGTRCDQETRGFCLALRCDVQNTASPFIYAGTGQGVVDCSISNLMGEPGVFPGTGNAGNVGMYSIQDGMKDFYCAGNDFDRSYTGEHCARFQGLVNAKFESNHWRGANLTKTLLAVRGMVGASDNIADLFTRRVIVDNDFIDPSGAFLMTNGLQFQAQTIQQYEPEEDILVMNTRFGKFTTSADFQSYNDIIIQVRKNFTLRNCTMDHSSPDSPTTGKSAHTGVLVYGKQTSGGVPQPNERTDDWLVKNVSLYSSTKARTSMVVAQSGASVVVGEDASNGVVKNCVADARLSAGNTPGSGACEVVTPGNATVAMFNNSTNTQMKTVDALFANPAVGFGGYTPGVGSYALTAGLLSTRIGVLYADPSAA